MGVDESLVSPMKAGLGIAICGSACPSLNSSINSQGGSLKIINEINGVYGELVLVYARKIICKFF